MEEIEAVKISCLFEQLHSQSIILFCFGQLGLREPFEDGVSIEKRQHGDITVKGQDQALLGGTAAFLGLAVVGLIQGH